MATLVLKEWVGPGPKRAWTSTPSYMALRRPFASRSGQVGRAAVARPGLSAGLGRRPGVSRTAMAGHHATPMARQVSTALRTPSSWKP